MTRIALGTLALAVAASAGLANPVPGNIDRSGYEIYTGIADEIGTYDAPRSGGQIYSDMQPGANGFVAFPMAPGFVASSDYISTASGDQTMSQFRFVGGVDTVGGVVFFDFFDAGAAFVDGFGVALPSAGDFIWTITFGGGVTVADAGFVTMTSDDLGLFGPATQARMFLGDNGATVGNAGQEDIPGFNFNYEMTVPAPGAFALMGLGGLVATRRRR